ncbi:hypothetical protein [Bradyrhizobium ottawaense]|uniref:hypothetical protein n=1 Tax=Bradyrhizobium ottawaense TaxID=931866 RepID=UPI0030F390A6
MTQENLAAGPMPAGIDLPATGVARHVFDITAINHEVEARIVLHDVGDTASTWLANARGALRSALQYVEQHFETVEAKAKAEVAEIEAEVGETLSSADAPAAAAAVASSGI